VAVFTERRIPEEYSVKPLRRIEMPRRVLITGGHGAIGSAITKLFIDAGEDVIRPDEKELDLESEASIEKFLGAQMKQGFEVIIHCAGYNNPMPFEDIPDNEFQRTMKVNLVGFRSIIKRLAGHFKKARKGHILAISSIYGSISRPGRSSYVISKHALQGLSKTLAIELGPFNVMVNTLSPGFVNTIMTTKNNSPEKIREFEKHIPLRRLALPEEIAEVAFFLCSPKNSYINGQNIIVDGGYIIGGFEE